MRAAEPVNRGVSTPVVDDPVTGTLTLVDPVDRTLSTAAIDPVARSLSTAAIDPVKMALSTADAGKQP